MHVGHRRNPPLLYARVAGDQSTHGYSAPKSFTVSNDAVAQIVQGALTNISGAAHLDGSPTVTCFGDTSCAIGYTVKEPTEISTNLELVQPTRR
jgi:hypothetical protein